MRLRAQVWIESSFSTD